MIIISSAKPFRLSKLCSSRVLFAAFSKGFGFVKVNGYVLVDFPAARITACILSSYFYFFNIILQVIATYQHSDKFFRVPEISLGNGKNPLSFSKERLQAGLAFLS